MRGGTQRPRNKRQTKKAKTKGRSEKKNGRVPIEMIPIFTTEKGLRGLGLMFIWQLKVSENPSRV